MVVPRCAEQPRCKLLAIGLPAMVNGHCRVRRDVAAGPGHARYGPRATTEPGAKAIIEVRESYRKTSVRNSQEQMPAARVERPAIESG